MDELDKILGIVGKQGWQSLLAAGLLLLLLRVGRPEVVAPAIARVYADVCRAIGTWWEAHRELVEAERDAKRAREARDRALEVAWSTAHPQGTRQVDRLVFGAGSGAGRGGSSGERVIVEAPAIGVGTGGDRIGGATAGCDSDLASDPVRTRGGSLPE